MAASNQPNVFQEATTALVTLGPAIPANFCESVSLRMSLKAGTADAYVDVFLDDTIAANQGFVLFQEPIRYRIQGGSEDLLLNFVLNAGQQVQIRASSNSVIDACLYNRYRFDA